MTHNLPPYLYHGTRAGHLSNIVNQALVPRGESGVSQWKHSVESRSDAVYLTTAYPLHFAINAQGDGDLLIIEIDTSKLDPNLFIADEDALAHSLKEPQTRNMNLAEKTQYYRERSHQHSASNSLALMGTCAYQGSIPAAALRRTASIKLADVGKLIVGGFDPVISPLNFKFFGKEYTESVKWLFGDEDVCALNPMMPRVDIIVTAVSPI
jgi:hypothetical protein